MNTDMREGRVITSTVRQAYSVKSMSTRPQLTPRMIGLLSRSLMSE